MSTTAPKKPRAACHGVAVVEARRLGSLDKDHILLATGVVEDMPIGDLWFALITRMRVPFSTDVQVFGVDVRRLP